MGFFSGKKLIFVGFLAVLFAVIPLTVFFLSQPTSQVTRAERATIMCFSLPETNGTCLNAATAFTKNVGEKFSLDVYLDPSNKNKIYLAAISINYDNTKLEADPSKDTSPDKNETTLGFFELTSPGATGQGFTTTLVEPTYTFGNASVIRSVGTDPFKAITQKTKIARIRFKALAATPDGTNITFDEVKSNATPAEDPEFNVLSPTQPALVKIAQAASTSPTPQPTGAAAPTPTTAAGAPKANQIPVCTGLNVDRTTSGPAPFSITFTANGNDPDGTVNKVTFDFGDGPVQDVTSGEGIGTKTVSVQKAHTYSNPGTYSAKVTFTDGTNALSVASASCIQTITVTQDAAGAGGATTPAPTVIAQAPTETPTPLPKKTFEEQPGPGDTILGIGAAGVIITIIGALLLFAL